MGEEKKFRLHFGDYLVKAEVFIYSVLAVLLFITALATVANAGKILWDGLGHWAIAAETLLVLDELLVVLMIVEILHTVRLSLRSHILVAEPFLIVGLIASVRRILVISLEVATRTKGGTWSADTASMFRASMLELGLLGLLILILVFSITLLRRSTPSPENLEAKDVLG
jgi:phosphate-starvation-inducible protein E